jgi:predicted TIM-barrel fold metal-dependent hydrolase
MMVRAGRFPNPAYAEGTRDLSNVRARIDHMDRLGVEVQVLLPSFFLRAVFQNADAQIALCKTYNRWLADVWSRGDGRLRWCVVAPLLDMKETISSLRFGKENGACAAVLRGVETNRLLSDPYFAPLYDEAQRLDLALCLHVGAINRDLDTLIPRGGVMLVVTPNIIGFHTLLSSDVPNQFPNLRFGFLESGSQWLPFALQEALRANASGVRGDGLAEAELARSKNFFVACQVDDDLPYIMQHFPHGRLVIGSDYGHADIGSDMEAHRILLDRNDIDRDVSLAIATANGRTLYGL